MLVSLVMSKEYDDISVKFFSSTEYKHNISTVNIKTETIENK